MGLRVAVAGAGLGGLCLAQGLARRGAEVTIYERDTSLDVRQQGYRLHLDARAGLALAECLPAELFRLFLATCGRPSRRMTVLTEKLRVVHEVTADPAVDPLDPATLSVSADRQTLREVLAAGLSGRLAFGHELTGYQDDGESVRLRFAGGQEATADVLVGADGVHSGVRAQYLPDATVTDTGVRCIYGKTPLTGEVAAALPPPFEAGFVAVAGGHVGMAAGLMRYRQRPDEAAASVAPGIRLSAAPDYLMWGVTAAQRDFRVPDDALAAMSAPDLHGLAATMIRSWHPSLRRLQALADPGQTFAVRIGVSTPGPGWTPSRVTVLGDAIHAMSPARGSGANTALRDAASLCRALTGPAPAAAALTEAIGGYEEQMRTDGYAAVAASREAESQLGAQRGGLAFWLYRQLKR